MAAIQGTRNINSKVSAFEIGNKQNKLNLNQNLLMPKGNDGIIPRKMSIHSRGSIHGQVDSTFGLTGLEDMYNNEK